MMRSCLILFPVLIAELWLASPSVHAQPPLSASASAIASHRLAPPDWIFSFASKLKFDTVTLQVTVDANGNVESAHAIAGPGQAFSQAEAAELKCKFRPFFKNGKAARARFEDYVGLFNRYPPLIRGTNTIHAPVETGVGYQEVFVRVILSATGAVQSARAILGPPGFYTQAERTLRESRFTSFLKDGIEVPATIQELVTVIPPEQWADPPVPFPPLQNPQSLRMKLIDGSQGNLYYSLEIQGNGDVEFTGGPATLQPGIHRAHVSQSTVDSLLTAFRQSNFFSLRNDYTCGFITDGVPATTSIEFDGHHKSVLDYFGAYAGEPAVMDHLKSAFAAVAARHGWIKPPL